MAKNKDFESFFKYFVITFFWNCCKMKVCVKSAVPVQIPYLGKFWFLSYKPKRSKHSKPINP